MPRHRSVKAFKQHQLPSAEAMPAARDMIKSMAPDPDLSHKESSPAQVAVFNLTASAASPTLPPPPAANSAQEHQAAQVNLGKKRNKAKKVPRGLANLGSFDAAKLAKLRMGIEATPGAVPVDRSTTKPAARANATSARAADHFVTEHAADVQPAPAATAKDSDAGSALTISTSSMPTLAPAGTSICENGAPADSAGAEAAVTAPGEAGAIVDEHNPIDSAVRPDAPAAALVAKAGAGCEAAATEDNAARAVDGAALHLPKGDTNVPRSPAKLTKLGAGTKAIPAKFLADGAKAARATASNAMAGRALADTNAHAPWPAVLDLAAINCNNAALAGSAAVGAALIAPDAAGASDNGHFIATKFNMTAARNPTATEISDDAATTAQPDAPAAAPVPEAAADCEPVAAEEDGAALQPPEGCLEAADTEPETPMHQHDSTKEAKPDQTDITTTVPSPATVYALTPPQDDTGGHAPPQVEPAAPAAAPAPAATQAQASAAPGIDSSPAASVDTEMQMHLEELIKETIADATGITMATSPPATVYALTPQQGDIVGHAPPQVEPAAPAPLPAATPAQDSAAPGIDSSPAAGTTTEVQLHLEDFTKGAMADETGITTATATNDALTPPQGDTGGHTPPQVEPAAPALLPAAAQAQDSAAPGIDSSPDMSLDQPTTMPLDFMPQGAMPPQTLIDPPANDDAETPAQGDARGLAPPQVEPAAPAALPADDHGMQAPAPPQPELPGQQPYWGLPLVVGATLHTAAVLGQWTPLQPAMSAFISAVLRGGCVLDHVCTAVHDITTAVPAAVARGWRNAQGLNASI